MSDPIHCDDYINDPHVPSCLRAFLEFKRRPAIDQCGKCPVLFATMKDFRMGARPTGEWKKTGPEMVGVPIGKGQRVRVVMASRFGDVGITPDLEAENGYVARVHVADLCDFSDDPQHGGGDEE